LQFRKERTSRIFKGVSQHTKTLAEQRSAAMGLDVLMFLADKEGDPDAIRASLRARYQDDSIVDEIQDDYRQWTQGTDDLALLVASSTF
jgi:hypothetical protein